MFWNQQRNKKIPTLKGKIDGGNGFTFGQIPIETPLGCLGQGCVSPSRDVPDIKSQNATKGNGAPTGDLKGKQIGSRTIGSLKFGNAKFGGGFGKSIDGFRVQKPKVNAGVDGGQSTNVLDNVILSFDKARRDNGRNVVGVVLHAACRHLIIVSGREFFLFSFKTSSICSIYFRQRRCGLLLLGHEM